MGTLLVRCGEYEEAIERFRQAVRTKPDFVDAWFNLGVVSSMASRVGDAVSAYRRAIELNPQAAKAHNNLAILFQANGRLEEAAAGYETALRHEPDYVEARYNLGLLRQQQGRHIDAIDAYQRVLKTAPQHVEAFNNLGNTLLALNRPMEAREAYRNALAVDAANTESIWNLGFVDLLLGNFEEGWRNYEWRFKQSQKSRRFSEQPRWQGEPLDTIQMIRFAGSIQKAGGKVVLECPPVLMKLLEPVVGIDEVIPRGQDAAFDVHLPLMSLPHVLGVNEAALPGSISYLSANPERAGVWRTRLENYARPRVGLVWSGNPNHANDRNRSMDPALLHPLLAEGGSFFTLQPDAVALDGMIPLGEMLTDFAETAAAISAMDLVISVDTSVAHLAGALGRPVWTLLPYAPDWRWMLDRTDSPWYPSMRLFRQETRGDWAGVVSRVIEELRETVSV
jgi:Flp pilus assembly protein TadD